MEAKCSWPCSQKTDTELEKYSGYVSYPYLFNMFPLLRVLPSGLISSVFFTKWLKVFLFSYMEATCPTHLVPFYFIFRVIFGSNLYISHDVILSSPLLCSASWAHVKLSQHLLPATSFLIRCHSSVQAASSCQNVFNWTK